MRICLLLIITSGITPSALAGIIDLDATLTTDSLQQRGEDDRMATDGASQVLENPSAGESGSVNDDPLVPGQNGSPVDGPEEEEEEEEKDDFKSFTEIVASARPAENLAVSDDLDGRQDCTKFEDMPTDPGANIQLDATPWTGGRRRVCKMYVSYSDRGTFVCSGSLVGPFHFITARHCTFNPCSTDEFPDVRVSCGFGFLAGTDDFAHFGSAEVTSSVRYRAHDDAATCRNGQSFIGEGRKYDIQICRLDRRVGDNLGWYDTTSTEFTEVDVTG